jgi:hypothetical protein
LVHTIGTASGLSSFQALLKVQYSTYLICVHRHTYTFKKGGCKQQQGMGRQTTYRERDLEEFRMTESLAWAYGNNSYSLPFPDQAKIVSACIITF